MKSYPPNQLVNTKLNPSELHYHSYTISPLRKLFNNYYRFIEYYTLHFTSERLIIEPYINYNILMNFYKFYSYLPLPENLLAIVNESRINKAKKSVELIKYKSISLKFTIIDSISLIKLNGKEQVQIKLKDIEDNYEISAFKILDFDIFNVYEIQEITWESLKNTFDSHNYINANYHLASGTSLFVKIYSKET